MAEKDAPDLILFALHGWAGFSGPIAGLARSVAPPNTRIIAPNLGLVKTWLRIEPLIARVESLASEQLAWHPDTPVRIIGHSMGGLIWLEVLDRHPEWWSRIESLVLIGSPVGGADIGRILDPLGMGIGIARDLGINRREMAEKIAASIPTVSIAGDVDNGSDRTVTLEATRFDHARWIVLKGIAHSPLTNHPRVSSVIRDLWYPAPEEEAASEQEIRVSLLKRLQAVPGMTDAHHRDCYRARPSLVFRNGLTLRTWKNPAGVSHVFLTDRAGACLYAGFVGWIHTRGLRETLEAFQKEFADALSKEESIRKVRKRLQWRSRKHK